LQYLLRYCVDNVFCGDSLFHADIGTARCDFPGGSAASLYESGHKLLKLPEYIKIWTGHDYVSDERDTPVPWMSVRDHKERNKHLSQGITQHEFVSRREERDATLEEPKLLNPSLQINIRAGRLPRPTILGNRFLHLPLKLKGAEW
jgi:glyoxylase-like metal-dependent hydrolase (beta-lactamase superfamily II)